VGDFIEYVNRDGSFLGHFEAAEVGVRTIIGKRTFPEAGGKPLTQYHRHFFNSPQSGRKKRGLSP
jgi:hypothetical protein